MQNEKGQFVKGFSTWNKGTKGIMKVNKTSFQKGQNLGNQTRKGKKHTEETKRKMSQIKKGKRPKNFGINWGLTGKGNPNYKGGITPMKKSENQLNTNYGVKQFLSGIIILADFVDK